MKLIAAVLLFQSLTIGVGEERQSAFWRTWAPRWDTYTAEVAWKHVVLDVAHKRGVAGLNPDRVFPTVSAKLQEPLGQVGPFMWNLRAGVYVDFGHIVVSEDTKWTAAGGLWGEAPVWGDRLWLTTAMYLRDVSRPREGRGTQSYFRAEARVGFRIKQAATTATEERH